MALIEGGQLGIVRRILQPGIDPATAVTNLDLASVSQTLPVVPEIVRRSAPLAGIDGFHTGRLRNVHSAADVETSTITPYAVGDAALGSYPSSVAEGWDLWLLAISGQRTVGAGVITGTVTLVPVNAIEGWGIEDDGTPLTAGAARMILGRITGIEAEHTHSPVIWQNEPGATFLKVGLRLPRGIAISFHSTSDALVTVELTFVMGLFPMAMGHDVLKL